MPKGIKPIVPSPIDMAEVQRELDLAFAETLELVEVEFQLFTAPWKTGMPAWTETKPRTTPEGARMAEYTTDDERLQIVDDGQKPHKIVPRPGKKFLRFKSGFVPSTKPGRIQSTVSASFGEDVFAKEANHPGSEPRNITTTIAEDVEEPFEKFTQQHINDTESV